MRDLSTLPKVELHLHLEGTLEPETVLELARRNKVELPYADLEDLRGRYEFTDLQSFLDLIYANLTVLQTEEDFSDLVTAYVARAAAGGVRHVEAFFDPQPHVARGIPLQRVLDGLASGIVAAERDHGIQAIDDPALMDRLAGAGTPLTMCPLSNVRLRCVDTLADHPLPAFLEAGVLVTVNSDDPAYFGGYADTNYEALRATFGFSDDVMARLARNSVTASFLPEGRKTGLLSEIDAWIAT